MWDNAIIVFGCVVPQLLKTKPPARRYQGKVDNNKADASCCRTVTTAGGVMYGEKVCRGNIMRRRESGDESSRSTRHGEKLAEKKDDFIYG